MIRWIYKITALFIYLGSLSLYGDSDYFFCIEGGGSKTVLQIVNQEGQIIALTKDGIKTDRIEATGSNINSIGPEGVRQVLSSLFEKSFLIEGDQEIDLSSLIPSSYIIAGMAGAGLPQNKQSVIALLQERGITSDHVLLMSDAEMALELMDNTGIILIAGTGSNCLGKRNEILFRVGGLGRILGDEGSGYQIGLQALKAALAEEYGWGISTTLTPALKELFQTSELKTLIPKINLGEISPAKIASIAPLVFSYAWERDEVAETIINQAAADLCHLLTTMINTSHLSRCEIHLWGGIFRNTYSEAFLKKIRERLPEHYRDLKMINRARDNPAVLLAVKKFIKIKERSQKTLARESDAPFN